MRRLIAGAGVRAGVRAGLWAGLGTGLLAAAPTVAAAQDFGKLELGAFGRYSTFGGDVQLAGRVGAGGRLAYFLKPAVALDLDASYTTTHSSADVGILDAVRRSPTASVAHADVVVASAENPFSYLPIRARLALNVPFSERLSVTAGLGGVLSRLRFSGPGAPTSTTTDVGATALLGARLHFTRMLALRVDGTADWVPNIGNSSTNAWNLGAQAGLSVFLGTRAAPGSNPGGDADGDGVPNRLDRCPGTAPHTAVDGNGCPVRKDSDGDGVSDLDDICPNTPAGAKVDENGCSEAQKAGEPAPK